MNAALRGPVLGLVIAFLIAASTLVARAADSDERAAIAAVLDDFHEAAAVADKTRYLAHFAPGGVFMGTDDWERWPLAEFEDYVAQRFAGGTGWTYVSEERHIMFADSGATAWFDEIMVSARWGRFRGTGVMVRREDGWKIAHYSLTALVPNERFEDVSAVTSEGFEARKRDAASK
jgi:hypothetical protein